MCRCTDTRRLAGAIDRTKQYASGILSHKNRRRTHAFRDGAANQPQPAAGTNAGSAWAVSDGGIAYIGCAVAVL